MKGEILVIYGMIERHLRAKHKACYFTASQNCASLNEELIYVNYAIYNGKKVIPHWHTQLSSPLWFL